jgi:hypothetical protein
VFQAHSNEARGVSRRLYAHEETQPVKQLANSRFLPKESQDQRVVTKKQNEKASGAQTNILTWDQPYDKFKDHQELKYESKEERRKILNMNHNE